jgi:hypothetical protein
MCNLARRLDRYSTVTLVLQVHQVDDSERQPGFWARKFKGVKQTESSSPGPVDQTRNSSSQPPPPAFAVVGIMVVRHCSPQTILIRPLTTVLSAAPGCQPLVRSEGAVTDLRISAAQGVHMTTLRKCHAIQKYWSSLEGAWS